MTVPQLTLAQTMEHGRALRAFLKRRDHAALALPERDVIGLLEQQHATRLPDLVPIRVGRMMQSPFAFYRGSAAQMAHDLRDAPRTDIRVVITGDAHLANFGFFASPERRLVFDLNDFDEVNLGPWEWDVKRLGASVVLAGRDIGMSEDACRDALVGAVTQYRHALEELYQLTALERFYFTVESRSLEKAGGGADRALMRRAGRKARKRTSERLLETITTEGPDGDPRIVDEPPVLRHLNLVSPAMQGALVQAYRDTIAQDVSVLLEQYRLVDGAFRLVGVGSVGLRAHIALLIGPSGEPLFLQVKEARPSVLVTHGGMPFGRSDGQVLQAPAAGREGWRVVTGQRIMQAVSDRFLGWLSYDGSDYYVRQFRDMKGAVDLASLTPSLLAGYAELCGALLARGHSQSPRGAVIHGYLEDGDTFARAIGDWSLAYADQAESDHATLVAAVRDGRLAAEQDV